MAQVKKILVAYDGSRHSKTALEWALDLSLMTNAKVVAVKVVEMREPSELGVLYEEGAKGEIHSMYEEGARDIVSELVVEIEELAKADQQLLQEAVDKEGKSKGVEISTAVLHGNIAASIIDYARKTGVDLIVVGAKGHGVLEPLLMGSVTRNLVSLSKVPVLVVKE